MVTFVLGCTKKPPLFDKNRVEAPLGVDPALLSMTMLPPPWKIRLWTSVLDATAGPATVVVLPTMLCDEEMIVLLLLLTICSRIELYSLSLSRRKPLVVLSCVT